MEDFQHLHQNLEEKKIAENKEKETTLKALEDQVSSPFSLNVSMLSDGAIHLQMKFPQGGINLKEVINKIENSLIMEALNRTGGNKNRGAKLLGLNRTTLIEKIKKKRLLVSDLQL